MSYIVPEDIPKNCFACPCGYETEGAFIDECLVLKREYEKDADSVRPNWCPLVEIKTPHGRLIDADELANKTFYKPTSAPYITYKTFCNAPTIIEAEGSET
jgi:hypothetical protein